MTSPVRDSASTGYTAVRPRSRRAHAAAVQAAAALLVEGGLTAATTDAVSARSGVSKATLYKHWPNRLALAIDAFTLHIARAFTPPDTGDTEQDLRAHMRMVAEFYGRPEGHVYAELLAAGVRDPAGAERLRTHFLDGRRELVLETWRRGVARGDLNPEIDFQAFNDVLFGALIFRLVSGHAALDAEQADRITDAALYGVLRSRRADEQQPADTSSPS